MSTEALKKVNKVCIQIQRLNSDILHQALKEASEQTQYTHPLKNGKANRINTAGERNVNILSKLIDLHKSLNQQP